MATQANTSPQVQQDDHKPTKTAQAHSPLQGQQDNSTPTRTDEPEKSSLSAAQRVFGIFELAEAIFLEMPPRDILLDQRVSRTWQSTIIESTPLQQATFNKPIPSQWYTFGGNEIAGEEHSMYQRSFFHHPLLDTVVDGHFHKSTAEKKREILTRPEASWTRQLLTQPPISGCVLLVERLRDYRTYEKEFHLSDQDGVRLGIAAQKSWGNSSRWVWISGWEQWYSAEWESRSARELLAMMKGEAWWRAWVEREMYRCSDLCEALVRCLVPVIS
ncbi:hypothetical protein CLAFUW4_09927 [Fulvia fulva]|uniref:F-box domain-containing protein n=1 Tax=Passalora fulva TaxID=5499 RepID=A0A9Q8UUN4_PASFU|nr:uncharacterized protein CLAFUR5_12316 [Fulvia fulva]KAK4616240.1 hypothetical protein CLAFUR4_09931 [Fulvia fulva]KAK4617298.1 hypothetical protein CLAFUR0_09926 [Fulvia fulva]UJO23139.1 hypothetical protein CLAFUR5_12316 [Fulvia fulva]WPV19012.1 hypothetical protein CLAFUW4_09927 [Fulvia fulva]WPV33890.1 hypothetical protein CLAFUW7_09928 [Fulvia fulva]